MRPWRARIGLIVLFVALGSGASFAIVFTAWALITHEDSARSDPVIGPVFGPITHEQALAEYKRKHPCFKPKTDAEFARCEEYRELVEDAMTNLARDAFDPSDYDTPLPP